MNELALSFVVIKDYSGKSILVAALNVAKQLDRVVVGGNMVQWHTGLHVFLEPAQEEGNLKFWYKGMNRGRHWHRAGLARVGNTTSELRNSLWSVHLSGILVIHLRLLRWLNALILDKVVIIKIINSRYTRRQ